MRGVRRQAGGRCPDREILVKKLIEIQTLRNCEQSVRLLFERTKFEVQTSGVAKNFISGAKLAVLKSRIFFLISLSSSQCYLRFLIFPQKNRRGDNLLSFPCSVRHWFKPGLPTALCYRILAAMFT